MAPRRALILDCDPGHDDAMAILLAAASPALDLRAITTVAGNQTLAKTTLNARRVCSVAGISDVPIAAGCDRPLVRDQVVAAEIHGESGLDGPVFGDPTVEVDPRHAVDLIIDEARATPGLALVAVGPLTNVATALQQDPELARRLGQIVIMGGAIGLGNTTPAAEFNIYVDPEAARVVFESGVPITMVPLEVTHRAAASDEVIERIARLGTPVAQVSVELLRFFAETYERVFGFPHPPVHDPCAVAWLIDPAMVETRRMHVGIETGAELCDGRTVCDVHGVTRRTPNADVGVDLDLDRFWDLMLDALARYPAAAGS
jgi:inosine-uridine nucleoside N-ribohydrolase